MGPKFIQVEPALLAAHRSERHALGGVKGVVKGKGAAVVLDVVVVMVGSIQASKIFERGRAKKSHQEIRMAPTPIAKSAKLCEAP
jgi:hypothetical protein